MRRPRCWCTRSPPTQGAPASTPQGASRSGGPVLGPSCCLLPSVTSATLPSSQAVSLGHPPHCPALRLSPWGPCRASPVSGHPVDPDGPARGPGNHAGLTRVHHTCNSCCFRGGPQVACKTSCRGVKFQDSALGKGTALPPLCSDCRAQRRPEHPSRARRPVMPAAQPRVGTGQQGVGPAGPGDTVSCVVVA